MNKDIREIPPNVQSAEETEQMLEAIRQGGVDAFLVNDPEGDRVYALEGLDLPYSDLVERMQQGAAMLNANGDLIYSNHALAGLLGVARGELIGRKLTDLVSEGDVEVCKSLVADAQSSPCEKELTLRCANGDSIPANFSLTPLSRDKSSIGVLVTDLRPQKQQSEFAARLQNMQDEERKRIARELHDSAGQLLAAIGINLAILQAGSQQLQSETAKAVSDSVILLDQVSREIRTMSHLLHPPLLDAVGLVGALRWYVDGFSERSKIKVVLQIAGEIGRLPEDMESAVFRIVQECLTNVHRHSGSSDATITLTRKGERLLIQVQDTGKGIPTELRSKLAAGRRGGVGFMGMRERLRKFEGSLDVQSPGSGTVVTAMLRVA